MAMPPAGTFEYVARIPDRLGTVFSCAAKLWRQPGEHDRDAVLARWLGLGPTRLVGPTPLLEISDAGPTPNHGPLNPARQRSRLNLIAKRRNATVAEASFILDQGVISALRPGDLLHLVRTKSGGIGVSVTRADRLIFAVGATSAIPLACDFQVRLPHHVVRESHAVSRKEAFEAFSREHPVEIQALDERYIMCKGRVKLGPFEVWVLHGHCIGVPGKNACVSVARIGACPVAAADSSALFLDTRSLEMVRW